MHSTYLFRTTIYGLLFCVVFAAGSCTKKYADINTDKNTIATVGPSQLAFLFSKAQSAGTHSQWNYQVAQNLFADQYAQYFACEATYFQTDRLFIVMEWAVYAFDPIYTEVVPQLKTIFENTDPNSPEYAIANIWWVYVFHRITDYWGPIPYFNAGVPGTSVPYDPQDKIYDDMFKRLDSATQVLSTATTSSFGSYDLIYGGDVAKWTKFANTLRLRLALRISQVDPTRAKTEGEAAYAGGVMESSPSDDALVLRSTKGDDGNGLSIMSDWNEFRMSAAMESVLVGYDDPRISEYFIPTAASVAAHAADPNSPLKYDGLRNGLSVADLTLDENKADMNSHIGPRWSSPSAGGISTYLSTPQNVMCAAEAWFLRAEGALLNWEMGGTAQELYENGIATSLNQWGITDNTTIQNYISSANTPVAPDDFLNSPALTNAPVKFSSDPDMQYEQVITQKWLALFPDGIEAWADLRRNRKLILYPVANSDNPDITNTTTQWIRRIPFLLSEKINNAEAVEQAVNFLDGPDKVTTPLWWDKN